MRSIRPLWVSPQIKGSNLPFSTGSSLALISTRTKHRRIAQRISIPIRWNTGAASPGKALQHRLQELKDSCPDPYPRLRKSSTSIDCSEFRSRYTHLANNETVEDGLVSVNGRVRTYRLAGSKLVFFDIVQDGHKVQIMCNFRRLDGATPHTFRQFYRLLRRGDAFSVTGKPHRTGRGELTVVATEIPQLLSPCLHDVPLDAKLHENSPYPRHVQFLADQTTVDTVKARSAIIQYLRQFFINRSFLEVDTPIINSVAGGAIARPFYTAATEFPERQLSLRIAPELWLKRFVVGGLDRVFEIGPSFRDEGLDRTHNPEFTTCEFYNAYSNLEDLMSTTEELLFGMAKHINELNAQTGTLNPTTVDFSTPFRRIDFIAGIEEAIGRRLPTLTSPTAHDQTLQIFKDLSLKLPKNPTLPRLLDDLSSLYLEPHCNNPTFIVNPPECLSPLSKSFTHPTTGQIVAARAELFIRAKEIVNTYEEENSPSEQRRKFENQMRFSKDANRPGEVDEEYLKALEWGLPPTGGWGCGVDRLVMLFTGQKKIADVLPFGNLRSVTKRNGGGVRERPM